MPQAIKFILSLFLILVFVLIVHLGFLNYFNHPLFANKIITAYIVNFATATIIYLTLFYLQYKYTAHLGFIFMAGSFIKFIIFFIVFYPFYKLDGTVSTLEFIAFFIPYSISLFFETFGIIKFLKK